MAFTHSLADHLAAADRSLTTVTRDGEELWLLTVKRTFAATPAQVWDALVSPERIPRWLMPVSGDLREGGRYQLEGNAGGEILACVEAERLSITWVFGDLVSWVDATLRPTDAGTLLQLDHTGPVDPDAWVRYGPSAVGIGWEQMLMGLAEHLAAPDAPHPAGPEGGGLPDLSEHVRGSAALWAEAAIAAGEDADASRAAAARCVAAYFGEPEPDDA